MHFTKLCKNLKREAKNLRPAQLRTVRRDL